jgi:hypothetical protein
MYPDVDFRRQLAREAISGEPKGWLGPWLWFHGPSTPSREGHCRRAAVRGGKREGAPRRHL